MRKILYVTGSRAEYGLMQSSLKLIDSDSELDLHIVATGMHLMPEFGNTITDVEHDGFKLHTIDSIYSDDSKEAMAHFAGEFLSKFVDALKKINPDIILLLGDRAEMLSAAVAGAYMSIPVAHIHGGDVSSTVDEMARHAITKLSEIHFAATESSAERIRKMGELPFNIHLVGAPGLDSILNDSLPSKEEVFKSLGLNSSEKTVLIVQHPITLEDGKSEEHMRATLEAVKEEGFQVIVVYPNADAGGREMISVIEEYEGTFNIFKSMERSLFLSLMKNSDLIIGNSSSALIEAPSFGTPAVNIGSRQSGRERSDNIIDSGYKKDEIISAIKKALSPEFIKKAEKCENPYGDGKSGERIVKILKEVELGRELLDKKIAY